MGEFLGHLFSHEIVTTEGMVTAIIINAFVHEYADNPIGNVALRILRTQLLEFSESDLDDPEIFIQKTHKNLLPTLVLLVLEHVPKAKVRYWYERMTNECAQEGLKLTELLEEKYNEHRIDELISDEYERVSSCGKMA